MVLRIDNRTRKKWRFFCLIFPHIRPSSVTALSHTLTILYNYASILSFFIVLTLMVLRPKKKNIFNSLLILTVLMEGWLAITTLTHGTENLVSIIFSFISSVSIPLIIYYYSDEYLNELLSALFMNLEWLIHVSLLSILLYYPNGMYISGTKAQYFLGNENTIIFYVIPALFLSFLHLRKRKRVLRSLALVFSCLANEVIVWCATGLFGIFMAVLVVFLSLKRKKQLSYYVILAGVLTADIMVSVVRMFDRLEIVSYIIQNWLGKEITLSGRTFIWDIAVMLIRDNLLSGLGRGNHVYLWGRDFHAHNEYFELLLNGGIPLLILFLLSLFVLGSRFEKRNTFSGVMALAMLTCLFTVFIATSTLRWMLYVPLILAYYNTQIEATMETERGSYDLRPYGTRHRLEA